MFLKDRGYINHDEPFQKLINQGMILGMSAFVRRLHFGVEVLDSKTNESLAWGSAPSFLSNYYVSKNISYDSIILKLNEIISDNKQKVLDRINEVINKDYKNEDVILKVYDPNKNIYSDIHVDVSLLKGASDELDTDAFKAWRPDYADAEFILEDGKYITGREVEKMSKSKYNVVNPDDICNEYGADGLRLYEMFLGPLEQSKPWNTQGLSGVYGFLKKFWNLYFNGEVFEVSNEEPTKAEYKVLHTLIKKVVYDIENFSFNTSVSSFMIAVNELQKLKCNKRNILEPLAVIISPYAPHICEELWSLLGNKESIEFERFPILDENYLIEDEIEYPVSVNGKMKFKIALPATLSAKEVEDLVLQNEKMGMLLEGKTPKKIIVVPKKIVNIVI